eukprot:5383126-Amphidinium_carterae.1
MDVQLCLQELLQTGDAILHYMTDKSQSKNRKRILELGCCVWDVCASRLEKLPLKSDSHLIF